MNSKTSILLNKHFKQDIKSFNAINKTMEKHEELMRINGDHMSFIRKDLTEVRDILVKNAEDTRTYRETVNNHMNRVEPVIKAYEQEKDAKEYINAKGEQVVKWGTRIGAISIIGSALIYIAKRFI